MWMLLATFQRSKRENGMHTYTATPWQVAKSTASKMSKAMFLLFGIKSEQWMQMLHITERTMAVLVRDGEYQWYYKSKVWIWLRLQRMKMKIWAKIANNKQVMLWKWAFLMQSYPQLIKNDALSTWLRQKSWYKGLTFYKAHAAKLTKAKHNQTTIVYESHKEQISKG